MSGYKINELEILASPEFQDEPTFGSYPITFSYLNDEVYITCKTITGTLTEIENFFNSRGKVLCYFGGAKIRLWGKGQIRIDCLEDNWTKAKIILLKAKKLKNESERQSGAIEIKEN